MLFALAEPATTSPSSFAEAVAVIARETILGAVALLGLGVALWAILQMKKTQDQRVEDTNKAADRLEKTNEADRSAQAKTTESVTKLAEAVTEMGRAIDRNTQNAKENSQAQIQALRDNTSALNNVVRDLYRGRSGSGSSGQMRAVTPESRDRRGPPLRREEDT